MACLAGAVVAGLGIAYFDAAGRETEAEDPSAAAKDDAGHVDFEEVVLGSAESVQTEYAVQKLKVLEGRYFLVVRLIEGSPEVDRSALRKGWMPTALHQHSEVS